MLVCDYSATHLHTPMTIVTIEISLFIAHPQHLAEYYLLAALPWVSHLCIWQEGERRKKWIKICKCQLNPLPFIKMCVCVCVCVCVTKIYTVGCFNSSWSKTESFSHPLSKRICARKGRFLTRYLIALNKTGLKNWCFQTAVLKKIPESPLNCKR